MKSSLKIIFLFTSLLVASQITSAAGMQNQLDNLFLEMENYTAPGSIETQRRSAYFGGRYTYKTAVFNENLISMRLPSARGGCGGIDMFGGSFSYINSDQIVQLLRQVAANAQGYAFQLAMDNMCPDCMKWMNELQTKMQALNENMSNSCQLAQGIINDASNLLPFSIKDKTEHSITASLSGIGDDFLDLSEHISTADTAVKRIFDSDPTEFNEKTGSVVYKALKQHSAQNWFAGGDIELMETIMSMTGSVVIGELVPGKDNQGETPQIWILAGSKVTMEELIDGANGKDIYDCAADTQTDYCRITPANTKAINIEGLKEKILTAFTGPAGLITWIRLKNVNGNLTSEQKNILAAMPHAIGSKIFQLAPISPEAAEQLVHDSIDAIALEYVYRLVKGSFQAVDIAMSNHENSFKPAAQVEIDKARLALTDEYKTLSARYGSINEIEKHYNEIIRNVQSPKYIPTSNLAGSKPE